MALAITGDFSGLDVLIGRVTGAAGGRYRRRLAARLAEEAKHQLQTEFAHSRDPYGSPWAPLKQERARNKRAAVRGGAMAAFARGARSGSSKPLEDTGRLKNSFSFRSDADGFEIGSDVVYMPAHQFGATYPPRSSRASRAFSQQKVHVTYGERKLPARPMLPIGQLGPIWGRAFEREAERFVRETFRGGR